MTRADQTWSLTAILFIGAIFLHLMNKEFPASSLTYLLLGAARYALLIVGIIILLGFIQYENQALRITALIITILIFMMNALFYLSQCCF